MVNQPTQKRARQESIEDDKSILLAPSIISRSPGYWFTDGSVVLQAESTQFRVHTSMLSLYSSVFQEMLRDFETKQFVEGCPVVHLPDSVSAVTNMLIGFYHREQSPTLPSMPRLSSMLELGKKYGIDFQYKSGLEVMHGAFPSTLEKWYSRNTATVFKFKSDIIECITLALKLNIRSVLPAAYLTICDDFDLILNGSRHPDGFYVQLPFPVQRVVIQGRDRMLKDEQQKTLAWLTKPSDEVLKHCLTPIKCSSTRTQAMVYLYRHSHRGKFCFWNVANALPENTAMCTPCYIASRQIHEKGCRQMWEDLPAYFEMPPWKDIIQ